MTVQINFILHGGGEYEDVEGTSTSCLTVQQPLTLRSLKQVFPFEGEFHFRLKRVVSSRTHAHGARDYMWVDIKDNEEIVAVNNIIDVQALCISLPFDELEYDDFEEAKEYLCAIDQSLVDASLDGANRPDRRSLKSSHHGADVDPITLVTSAAVDIAKNIQASKTMKSMTKTAGSLWSSMKSAATSVGLQLTTPTDNLDRLHLHVSTQFDESSGKHTRILEELWDSLFPGYLFEMDCSRWKTAGFQKTNPTHELKSSGILALKSMLYMAKTYPDKTQQMLEKNSSNVKTNYPFAVVGVNMTILLCDILGIRDKRYTKEDDHTLSYYEIFEDRKSFYEIYCFCFFYLDHIWKVRKAIRKDFVQLIDSVKSVVASSMNSYPHSMSEFKSLAAKIDASTNIIFECESY